MPAQGHLSPERSRASGSGPEIQVSLSSVIGSFHQALTWGLGICALRMVAVTW